MRVTLPDRPPSDDARTPGDGTRAIPALPAADGRLAPIVTDLRARLRPVCGHFGEAEFEALVQHIARTKLRWSDPGARNQRAGSAP